MKMVLLFHFTFIRYHCIVCAIVDRLLSFTLGQIARI